MEEMGRAILAVTPHGRILWATPRVAELLTRYGEVGVRRSDRLPSPIREWATHQSARLESPSDFPVSPAPLTICRDTGTLTIRAVPEGNPGCSFWMSDEPTFRWSP